MSPLSDSTLEDAEKIIAALRRERDDSALEWEFLVFFQVSGSDSLSATQQPRSLVAVVDRASSKPARDKIVNGLSLLGPGEGRGKIRGISGAGCRRGR
jgi:hypothetical protein